VLLTLKRALTVADVGTRLRPFPHPEALHAPLPSRRNRRSSRRPRRAADPRSISDRGPRLTQERVLAEAVSSYSDTGQFFLGRGECPAVYPARLLSERARRRLRGGSRGGDYRVFGPYRGPATRDPWQVLSITVSCCGPDSGERDLRYDPRRVDAVFLSVSAVRKFMLPYYRRLYGSDFAKRWKTAILVPSPQNLRRPRATR